MENKKSGNQLRDALLAAGLKPSGTVDTRSATKPASPPVDGGGTSRQTSPRKLVNDLPASWSQSEPDAGTGFSGTPRRKAPQSGVGNKAEGRRTSAKGNDASALPSRPSAPKQAPLLPVPPPPRLLRKGAFHPHPLLDLEEDDETGIAALARIGNERQMTTTPSDATDFVIGLDFGTSTTKVILRDSLRQVAFPVRFREDVEGIDSFLLPSTVYRSGSVYSLSGGKHRIRDLKLRLLHAGDDETDETFNDCCAYIALVIRRSRAWLFTAHGREYSKHQIEWRVNLGLAARSYEDEKTELRFRMLAWAAANVAALPSAEITVEAVETFRRQSLIAIRDKLGIEGIEFTAGQVDVVPEISAQLQGFMRSARWDWINRPVMMLVDIGAGTVDAALFMVGVPAEKPPVLIFFANRVEQNGVINLHRERVQWLDSAAKAGNAGADVIDYLGRIRSPTDRLQPVPESVRDYVPGYEVSCNGLDVDEEFMKERYRRQVAGCISDAKIGKKLSVEQLTQIPILLCGGGSRMRYFARIIDIINATSGWLVSVEKLSMPVPQELSDNGISPEEFDRLSVAFGLAQVGDSGNSIGDVVRAIHVPPYGAPEEAYRPELQTKDHV